MRMNKICLGILLCAAVASAQEGTTTFKSTTFKGTLIGTPAAASVAFDTVGPSSSGTSVQAVSNTWTTFTLTWTHVTAASAYLFVGVAFTPQSSSVATVTATYNGVLNLLSNPIRFEISKV